MRKFLTGLLALIIAAGIGFFVGPRTPVDTTITVDRASIMADPVDWIARTESAVTSLTPGMEKEIIWAYDQSRAKTPLAIVYVHGFSATKQEVRPLPDMVAKALGANLYFARLTGHGENGEMLARATVNDWVNDFAAALAVGKAIGEKVVVMSTSTGASIATWAAGQPELAKQMDGLVFISPNYQLQADGSFLLTQPWAEQLANLIVGPERSFETKNADHAKYWTTRYPTRALLPMAETVELARDVIVERVMIPALFIYAPADQVVDHSVTAQIAARWGGPHDVIEVTDSENTNQHVIAGDILSPNTTAGLADKTTAWIKNLTK